MLWIERSAFAISVLAGLVAAIAGGTGAIEIAIAAGCISASAPIAGRVVSKQLERSAAKDFEGKIASAELRASVAQAELAALQARLEPRRITEKQAHLLCTALSGAEVFPIGVNHNRHEAEPSCYSEEIRAALRRANFEPSWSGGMTNSTIGVEISGPDCPDKRRLIAALAFAQIDHLNIQLSDDPGGRRGIELWVGTHPFR